MYRDWWDLAFYIYTDSTGAEYRLDQWNATSRTWTSKELFLTYEEDTKRLRMNDGTFWVMNAEASEGEEDAGTRYPTLMQDTNGNQIRIDYQQGRSAVYANSSGRPTYLWDGRSKVNAIRRYRRGISPGRRMDT